CLANHGGDCQSEVPTIDKLRVIDCRLRTVVPAPPNCSYAALSYVWSQVHSAPQLNQEASKTLPSRMPRLVEDSLAVALQLGYSYIWIDRYCIDQLDEETKHMQIRQMDQIYAAAKVTIIAAGDQHPSGLHGASGTPRRYHSHVHLRDCTLVSTLPTLEYAIEQSPWSKRGWTYQEMILSKRRVYFTPWQVYYEC
ncbi:HET-domain-containing protein, partial [Polyplosphaeria fusca]